MTTLRDIAEALGVSRTSVSNAFNRPDQLSPDLKDRILAKAKELGYLGPDPVARMLRTGQAGAIGIVFAESLPFAFSDPAAITLLQGVAAVCEPVDKALVLLPALDEAAAQTAIRSAAVDGFIVYCLPEGSPVMPALRERGRPLATVDQRPIPGIPAVRIDDRAGAETCARHLLDLGHRRFGIIAMEMNLTSTGGLVTGDRFADSRFSGTTERLRGYERGLGRAGILLDQVVIYEADDPGEEAGKTAALTVLQQSPRPTALLVMSDRLAIGAMQAAEALGLAVPRDLSIVGFDDIPAAAQVTPALTTIRQPFFEKGRTVAAAVLDPAATPDVTLFPYDLIVRSSTGPAPDRAVGS